VTPRLAGLCLLLGLLASVASAQFNPDAPMPPAQFTDGVMQGQRILTGTITSVVADYDLSVFGPQWADLPESLRHCRASVLHAGAEEIVVNCYSQTAPCEPGRSGRFLVVPIIFTVEGRPVIHYALNGFTERPAGRVR
jgi:hypothetical protein